jgi:hypothetical protein
MRLVAITVVWVILLGGCSASDSLPGGRDAAEVIQRTEAMSDADWSDPLIVGLEAYVDIDGSDVSLRPPDGFTAGGVHHPPEGFEVLSGYEGPAPSGRGECRLALLRELDDGRLRVRASCDDI